MLALDHLDHLDRGDFRARAFVRLRGLRRRSGEIVAGKRAVTADTGLRLAQFFGTSEGFWTGLQDDHDRATTKQAIAASLRQITPWNGQHAA